jgi:hypothetical protein
MVRRAAETNAPHVPLQERNLRSFANRSISSCPSVLVGSSETKACPIETVAASPDACPKLIAGGLYMP